MNETSAPHLHRCPPHNNIPLQWPFTKLKAVCVCVQVRVDTPENDIEPAFLIPVLRLIGGQLSIVVAVVPPPVFLCCLWFLLTHTVQLLHRYNTTCNFNDLFKFTSQMKFFVSSYM